MDKLIVLLLLCWTQFVLGQYNEETKFQVGVNAEYAYSGNVHSIVLGPGLYWTKKLASESVFSQGFNISGGIAWGNPMKSTALSSVEYHVGYMPGIIFGLSSQQYYNMETSMGDYKTDVRLSGEVILAFFGFLGYRYQHPLIRSNEAIHLSRHAFFFKLPIPIKTLNRN